jgi:hypothetical protein
MRDTAMVPSWVGSTLRASPTPFVGAAALLLVAAGLIAISTALRAAPPSPSAFPMNPQVESRWGIRPTLVAATADGGLVDFRFIVLDPEKASALLGTEENLPVLRTEDRGTLVNSAAAMAGGRHDYAAGHTYFLLYRNTNGAIRPGTPVTILIGELKIEHVIAR